MLSLERSLEDGQTDFGTVNIYGFKRVTLEYVCDVTKTRCSMEVLRTLSLYRSLETEPQHQDHDE